MENKKALLGQLKIDAAQRQASSSVPRLIVTGAGALVLAAIAWFWIIPTNEPVPVSVAKALKAGGQFALQSAAVLDATGYVTARRQATVSSKITAKVKEVFIEEGLRVEEGQLLATLDDSTQRANLDLANAQLEAAKARLNEVEILRQEAELKFDRTVELEQKNLASIADLDRDRLGLGALVARLGGLGKDIAVAHSVVAVQKQLLDDMQIRAPFAGVVIAKSAQPGEMISPISAGGGFTRTGICTIVDMDSLEIEVDVNEAYINRVKSGQPVSAMLNSYPDWQIPAEVITIIPTADRSKATVKVRIRFLVKDSRILPDMGIRVAFLEQQVAQPDSATLSGVMVPASAVTLRDDNNVIFVITDSTVSVRTVKLGPRNGSNRNVTQGVRAGETVVTQLDDVLIEQLEEGTRVTTES